MGKNSKWLQKLTPQMAWDQYVNLSVEFFISLYRSEGITDIKQMCQICASETPGNTNQLFTQDQLELIAELLEKYIYETGYDEDKMYTEEEVIDILEKETDLLRSDLRKR